jgi:glycosyltransferase involved in cell wall biosynthesis
MHRTADVLIVQDYIAEYRRRFYELLEAALVSHSVRMRVAVGTAPAALAARGDVVASMPAMRSVPESSISVAGRRLTYKRLSRLAADADLVVVEQALRHLELYTLLARRRRGPKVALWGHGARRVKPASRIERLIERGLIGSTDWFFAYTQGGAEQVAAGGLPRERITVVQNTVDVEELARLRESVSADDQRLLREQLDLPAENVCLYVGALDASKRIGFLLDACAIVASRIPEFVLIVAGDGSDRGLVQESLVSSPWLRYVGRANHQQEAKLGAVSDALLMPGRVGLVAVDSFALRTPIITTHWPYHAPEVEYLENGVTARIAGDSVEEFAQTVEQVLVDRDGLARLKAECAAAIPRYSLEGMVANFTSGVIAALGAPRR